MSTYSNIAFTPHVQAMQTLMGSRTSYARMQQDAMQTPVGLGQAEIAFIAQRDGFYQASVGETGWPYVQFRGGPAGFLKVLGPQTIAYADFRGNRQYISVGNLMGNDKVSIILMDYAKQRRLKLLGQIQLIAQHENPGLMQALSHPDYTATVERACVISIAGFNWNCPQHITPRYTEKEWRAAGG